MGSYILRHINPELWARVKARAAADEMPMKAIILKLLELYSNGDITIRAERSDT